MPPVLVIALGAAGAAVLARVLLRESRRVNRILDPHRPAEAKPEPSVRLQRDPVTGTYRPHGRATD